MANTNADVIRVRDTNANLDNGASSTIRQKQIGFGSDSLHKMYWRDTDDTIYKYIPDGQDRTGGNMYVTEGLYHVGDTDTGINYTPDRMTLSSGNVLMIDCLEDGSQDYVEVNGGEVDVDFVVNASGKSDVFFVNGSTGEVVCNESGAAANFRVESNNNLYMLFVDGTNDRVGINEGSPDTMLHITSATSTKPVLKIENTNSDNKAGAVACYKVSSSPIDDDQLGRLSFFGNNSTPAECEFSSIFARSKDVTATDEAGSLTLVVNVDGASCSLVEVSGYNGTVGEAEIIFNQDGVDCDMRWESDGNANAMVWQGNTGYVGIGETPSYKLHVVSADTTATANANADVLVVENTTNAGISILTSDVGDGAIYFGTPSDDDVFVITADYAAAAQTASLKTGGNTNVTYTASSIILNPDNDDMDVQIQGDTNDNFVNFDSNAETVAIGAAVDAAFKTYISSSGHEVLKLHSSDATNSDIRPTIELYSDDDHLDGEVAGGFDFQADNQAGTKKQFGVHYLLTEHAGAGSEGAKWVWRGMDGSGSLHQQMYLDETGALYVDADQTGPGVADVGLFDEYDDPLEVKRVQQMDIARGCELGVYRMDEKQPGHWHMNVQRFSHLLAGGIAQLYDRMKEQTAKIESLENRLALLK